MLVAVLPAGPMVMKQVYIVSRPLENCKITLKSNMGTRNRLINHIDVLSLDVGNLGRYVQNSRCHPFRC